jgi:hypothetical protein
MEEFDETFEEEVMPILFKFYRKYKMKEHNKTHSMKPAIHSLQNPIKMQQQKKRELQTNTFTEYRCKHSQQNIAKQNSTTQKRSLLGTGGSCL